MVESMRNYVIKVDGDNIYLEDLEACPEGDPELEVMQEAIRSPGDKRAPHLELVRLDQGEMYVDEDACFKDHLAPNMIATLLYWMTHGRGNQALLGNALLRLNDDVTTNDIARLIQEYQEG
jgi:hypothetical protein